jgi:hypothetical protein
LNDVDSYVKAGDDLEPFMGKLKRTHAALRLLFREDIK